MSEFVETPGPGPLLAGELVDDHEVDSFDQDAFGHKDFVRELAGLVLHAPTPANVALFGAWGSGKSGIAKLLARELEAKKQSDVRMACFDASKYAEAPLRRHFISRVATELQIESRDFHDGLYTAEDVNDVQFGERQFKAVLSSLVIPLLLVAAVIVGLAGVFSWVGDDSFVEALLKVFAVGAPTSVLLGVIAKVATDGFTVTRTRSVPSGDEEFEACFRALVKEAKTKRLIVFVDELDRCAPREVASVLETLKTFLFVPGCLFIVAADQQVLEQALREEVRQHTPRDATNPYYSAGSSYLDKVFQYQLTLPPLKATTLSRFALRICEDLPGVWQRVPQLDEVISILIPTHVVSPRRVKVLLNRYAIAYRLAERRAAEGRLDRDVGRRAIELGKLVCLQCEFPLFAEDLRIDARLPDLVRKLADDDELPKTVRTDVMDLARRYADRVQPVARLLASDEAQDAHQSDSRRGSPESESERVLGGVEAVGRQYAQQLVNYLRKTREVSGPGPDLLFLESAGAEHGVDAIRAEELHHAAIDNDVDRVLALVSDVSSDDEARGALLVLADVVREDQPGFEGRNAQSSLLQAIERSKVEPTSQQADYMADAITDHLSRVGLDELDLPGALKLSSASNRNVASKLFRHVVEHQATTIDPPVASLVVGYLTTAPADLASRVEMIVAVAVLGDPSAAAVSLQRLGDERARELVAAASEEVSEIVRLHYQAAAAGETEDDEQKGDPEDLLELDPTESLSILHDALRDECPRTAQAVLRAMLDLSVKESRDAVSSRLAGHAPIEDSALQVAVVKSVQLRRLAEWPRWLDSLSPAVFADDRVATQSVGGLVSNLWRKAIAAGQPDKNRTVEAVGALGRLAEHVPPPTRQVRDAAEGEDAATEILSLEDLESRQRIWVLGDQFEHAGLVDHETICELALSAVAATLRAEFPVHEDGVAGAPPPELFDGLLEVLRERGQNGRHEALSAIADAAETSSWLLDGAPRCLIVLRAIGAAGQRFELEASLPDASTINALARDAHSDPYAREAVGIWVEHHLIGSIDLFDAFASLDDSGFAGHERSALANRIEVLDSADRWALVMQTLEAFVEGVASLGFVECIRLSSLDSGEMANLLSGLWSPGLRLEEKERLLSLWMLTKVSSPAALQRLVREIYIPLAQSGTRSLDLAIQNFGLVAHVKKLRGVVREALRSSAANNAQRERIEQKFQEAGWKSRSIKSLGRPRDVD